MDKSNTVFTALGGLILALALVSRRIQTSPFPPTLFALAFGILLGPAVLGVIALGTLGDQPKILEDAARLTLSIGLMDRQTVAPTDRAEAASAG